MTAAAGGKKAAAFFDVDGTLVKSTIAHYYVYFRRRRMAALRGYLWYATFLARCVIYLIVDRFDRTAFNVMFYRNYAGLPAAQIKAMAAACHEEVIRPRCFADMPECLQQHQDAGRPIVLVTGSVDFIVRPLAEELRASAILAPALLEADSRFTGALDGPPLSEEEKARRMRQYAATAGIDLDASYAYGDSIADLPMLEAVGHPHAVNPDKRLAAVARDRGWPILNWTVGGGARADAAGRKP